MPKKNAEKCRIFLCNNCNFVCSKQSNYDKHVSTLKHKIRTNTNEYEQKNAEKKSYDCQCGKSYKHASSLWNHKAKCDFLENDSDKIEDDYSSMQLHVADDKTELTQIILELVRENKEFKNMLVEQHNTIIEMVQKPNITNYNKQFNLNFFLNEQCKNAINLTEFVENVKLKLTDLENIADIGYVDGVTKILINGLKDLDIYRRPLHCTDVKREILHIRENNIWIKDTPEQEKIKSAIRRIAFRNIQQISEWNKLHPDSQILDSTDYNRSFQIMRESLGNTCPGGVEKNNERVVKNIMKSVYIDKNDMTLQNTIYDIENNSNS
jgi:hypothetical protein